jgi:hypothetical protein
MLGRFRLAAARYPHDPDFAALITDASPPLVNDAG